MNTHERQAKMYYQKYIICKLTADKLLLPPGNERLKLHNCTFVDSDIKKLHPPSGNTSNTNKFELAVGLYV